MTPTPAHVTYNYPNVDHEQLAGWTATHMLNEYLNSRNPLPDLETLATIETLKSIQERRNR